MNVLVIGANGQIGKHLVQKIEQQTSHTARAMYVERSNKKHLKNQEWKV